MGGPSRHEVLERRTGRSSCVEFPTRRCYQNRRGFAAAVEVAMDQETGISPWGSFSPPSDGDFEPPGEEPTNQSEGHLRPANHKYTDEEFDQARDERPARPDDLLQ